jgi:hypothetical protein
MLRFKCGVCMGIMAGRETFPSWCMLTNLSSPVDKRGSIRLTRGSMYGWSVWTIKASSVFHVH